MEKLTHTSLKSFRACLYLLAITLSYFNLGCLLAAEAISWNGHGAVLLKNGNVFQGNVIPQGKTILVKLDDTGEVTLSSQEVVTVAEDVKALYQYQIDRTRRWDSGEHFQIAKWCIRHGLIEQSKYHYGELRKQSGSHAKFKQMDSELRLALLQDPTVRKAMEASGVATPLEPSKDSSNEKSDSAKSGKQQVSMLAGQHGLDRLSQEFFRVQIQPFMSTRCGQAGCHGSLTKSDFHVAKSGVIKGLKAADASYLSAVQFFPAEPIETTPLWRCCLEPHGGQAVASLSLQTPIDRNMLERLRQWHLVLHRNNPNRARLLTPTTTNEQVASSVTSHANEQHSKPSVETQRIAPNQFATTSNDIPPFDANLSDTESSKADAELKDIQRLPQGGKELLSLEKEIARLEAIEKSRKKADPHDPAEFNRRYATRPVNELSR